MNGDVYSAGTLR